MGDAVGLLMAAISVGVLVFTKPHFFWDNAQMRRARGSFTDAEVERIAYAFVLFIMGLALVLMAFG